MDGKRDNYCIIKFREKHFEDSTKAFKKKWWSTTAKKVKMSCSQQSLLSKFAQVAKRR